MVDKLFDINVEIGTWNAECTEENAKYSSQQETQILKRIVNSYHPSKITFPGLPSHAEVFIYLIDNTLVLNMKPILSRSCSPLKHIPSNDSLDRVKIRLLLKSVITFEVFRTVITSVLI